MDTSIIQRSEIGFDPHLLHQILWVTKKDEEKIKQFKQSLKVIRGNDLKDVFNYVINKYGNDYTSLYEK